MNLEEIPIKELFLNDDNPRSITKEKLSKLKKSIKEFPEMLKLRPIVIDENNIIIGGNMRYQACLDLGMDKVYIVKAENLTDDQKKQFIIKDNVGFGDWDWDILANEWQEAELAEWGLDVWQPEEDIDYSILDDDDIDSEIDAMTSEVKKAIQIEFDLKDYDLASELVKYFRLNGDYVGGLLIECLTEKKESNENN